jgi:hypothetical protein
VIGGWVLLPTRDGKESGKENEDNSDFHFLVPVRFRLFPVTSYNQVKHETQASLIRETRQSRSLHSSCGRFLVDFLKSTNIFGTRVSDHKLHVCHSMLPVGRDS